MADYVPLVVNGVMVNVCSGIAYRSELDGPIVVERAHAEYFSIAIYTADVMCAPRLLLGNATKEEFWEFWTPTNRSTGRLGPQTNAAE